MTRYLLIESRDPFEVAEVERDYALAGDLAHEGATVAVFLVQNGVLPVRRGAKSAAFDALATSGVELLADDFSLRERGIAPSSLAEGVGTADMDLVVDRLGAGDRCLWL